MPVKLRRRPRFKIRQEAHEQTELQLQRLLKVIEPLCHAMVDEHNDWIYDDSQIKACANSEMLWVSEDGRLTFGHLSRIGHTAQLIIDERKETANHGNTSEACNHWQPE